MAKKAHRGRKELRLNVRVTERQLAFWGEAARRDGRKLSGWAKWILTNAAEIQLGKKLHEDK